MSTTFAFRKDMKLLLVKYEFNGPNTTKQQQTNNNKKTRTAAAAALNIPDYNNWTERI